MQTKELRRQLGIAREALEEAVGGLTEASLTPGQSHEIRIKLLVIQRTGQEMRRKTLCALGSVIAK